jgi:alkylated DNA repair dioxygenase AlkB
LDLAPGWLTGDAQLFDQLSGAVQWSQPEVTMYDRQVVTPRLVARLDSSLHPALEEAVQLLSARYGRRLCHISANWYRTGDDSVAWHGDRVARDLPEAVVATASLRGPREFRYRPADGGESSRVMLGNGDLVTMGGSFQRTWRHAVPKTRGPAPPRMVVMFRHAYD